MIAGRRARKRSLIRSSAMTAAMVRTLSSLDGVAAYQSGAPSELGHANPNSSFSMSARQPELTMYLRQLFTLHAAGVLTDEEFSAASWRLFGS
jgi:hypothetical protein